MLAPRPGDRSHRRAGARVTVEGVWINDYGSLVTLAVAGDWIVGTYASTTGSTGEFPLIGCRQTSVPQPPRGLALAFTISWFPIAGGPPAPNSHWSSCMTGQISVRDGAETMTLSHALLASNVFPDRCEAGTYIDKLNFRRVEEASSAQVRKMAPSDLPVFTIEPEREHRSANSASSPLDREWVASDGTVLRIRMTPHPSSGFGWLSGSLTETTGEQFPIAGVTDINAMTSGLDLQSMAITARSGDASVTAWAGYLDLPTDVLRLLRMCSAPTTPDATYLQTTASGREFTSGSPEQRHGR